MIAPSLPPSLSRPRLVAQADPRVSGERLTWVIAPAGYGKSALLAEIAHAGAGRATPAVLVGLSACEAHLGLFLDALARAIRQVWPAADLRMLREADVGREDDGWLGRAIGELLNRQGSADLVLLVDDAHLLRGGDHLTRALGALVAAPPEGLCVLLTGRERPALGLRGGRELGRSDLELTEAEVHELLAARLPRVDRALSGRVFAQTGGWPAVVQLVASAAASGGGEGDLVRRLAAGDDPLVAGLVDHLLAPLRPEARYFAAVAALFERFDQAFAEAVFSPEVPGTPEARRRLIRLTPRAIAEALAQLRDVGALVVEGDGRVALHPVCRGVLADGLKARDPEAYREGHRRAAEISIARAEPGRAPLDHLVEADAHDRLLEVLEGRAEAFFAAGELRALSGWLQRLASREGGVPFWVDYYLGRIASAQGDWDEAKVRLDEARAAVEGGRAVGADPWRWQPRLALAFGTLYWRRGQCVEARTWAQRGADVIEQHLRRGRVPEAARVEVSVLSAQVGALLGRVTLDTATADKAREVLDDALSRARAAGAAALEAQILADLAIAAARAGQLGAATAARDEGLVRAGRGEPAVAAVLVAAAVPALVAHGELTDATAQASRAVELALRAGDPEAGALAHTALARLLQAEGRKGEALRELEAAAEQARRAARVVVLAEALDRLALATLRVDSAGTSEAASLHEAAEAALAPMLKLEGFAVALHREVAAELRLAREGSPRAGLQLLEAARDTYDRAGAVYDVARLHWRQAEIHHLQAEAGDADAREEAMAQLEDACVVLDEHGLVLEDEPSRRALALIGARVGEDEMRSYCLAVLSRLGLDPAVEFASAFARATVHAYGSARIQGAALAPYRVTTRDGALPLDAEAYAALVADGGPSLVALVAEQVVLNFGKRLELGQKRVMFPLLLTFLRAPNDPFSMRELALAVWGDDDFGPTTQTKVKVAVSRLRTLLGKSRKYIVTTQVSDDDDDDEAVVAYQLAPNLAFKILEKA